MKYLLYAFALIVLFFAATGIYQQVNKKGANISRIPCQKEMVAFERIYHPELLEHSKAALLSGNYELASYVKKAKYMKSRLFDYVNLKDVDKLVAEAIDQRKQAAVVSDRKLHITYYIYENDKEDPGKKTPKSKLYAGYVHFTFKIDGRKVYVNQMDFMDLQGKDIHKRVDCAIESFITAGED